MTDYFCSKLHSNEHFIFSKITDTLFPLINISLGFELKCANNMPDILYEIQTQEMYLQLNVQECVIT